MKKKYSILALLVSVSLLSCFFAVVSSMARRQRATVDWVYKNNGEVTYSFEIDEEETGEELNLISKLISNQLGVDYVSPVVYVGLFEEKEYEFDKLSNLPRLRFLELAGTNCSDLSFVRSLNFLEVVNFTASKIRRLDGLSQATNLKHLEVASTYVDDLGPISNLRRLEVLDIGATDINSFLHLKKLTNLVDLWASHTKIRTLVGVESLKSLRRLDVSGTQIDSIDELKNLTQLKTLNLSATNVASLEALWDLEVEELNIAGTFCSNPGDIIAMGYLKRLTINQSSFSEGQIPLLKQKMPNCEVIVLDY